MNGAPNETRTPHDNIVVQNVSHNATVINRFSLACFLYFNAISKLIVYLMSKPSFSKNSSRTIKPTTGKLVPYLSSNVSLKVNVIA